LGVAARMDVDVGYDSEPRFAAMLPETRQAVWRIVTIPVSRVLGSISS